jgi:predicted RecA/RadA family phage recombinase
MASNRLYTGKNQTLPNVVAIAQTASRTTNQPISGDPCVFGQKGGVALENVDANGRTVMQIDGIFSLLVQGNDQNGASAVSGGDIIYFAQGDTPPLSKKNTGVKFGYAFGDNAVQLVASGNTTTAIPVLVI